MYICWNCQLVVVFGIFLGILLGEGDQSQERGADRILLFNLLDLMSYLSALYWVPVWCLPWLCLHPVNLCPCLFSLNAAGNHLVCACRWVLLCIDVGSNLQVLVQYWIVLFVWCHACTIVFTCLLWYMLLYDHVLPCATYYSTLVPMPTYMYSFHITYS